MPHVEKQAVLNLFYDEPDPDRWLPYDRYVRGAVRRLVRGLPRPGGQKRVFLNLCAGLDRIGVRYRVNDYRYIRNNGNALACIVGKPCVLDKMNWKNPILFGAAIYSHPGDDPTLMQRLPVKKVLVPGPWMKEMCEPVWGAVEAWPVGIDTDAWAPSAERDKACDVLLYDKVRWDHDRYEADLIEPIRTALTAAGRSLCEIRYGHYEEDEFRAALSRSRCMVFLCEHETQGIAYQQALACGVPIFAWDRGGHWWDPAYFPHKAEFAPVTSVPYWDDRCGRRFADLSDFRTGWEEFWDGVGGEAFRSRDYVLENLTLEKCACDYLRIAGELAG